MISWLLHLLTETPMFANSPEPFQMVRQAGNILTLRQQHKARREYC